jgi:hypothetical protein
MRRSRGRRHAAPTSELLLRLEKLKQKAVAL